MNKRYRIRIIAVLLVIANLLTYSNPNLTDIFISTSPIMTQAASIPTVSKTKQSITIGKQMKIKPASSYKKPTYKSSNTKVATVSKSGLIKAKMLGETQITVSYKNKSKSYYITVVPVKKTDLKISQNVLLDGQSTQLKLVSDKYDTSQIKLRVKSNDLNINSKGTYKGIPEVAEDKVTFYYGTYQMTVDMISISGKITAETTGFSDSYVSGEKIDFYIDDYTISELQNRGVVIQIDQQDLKDSQSLSPGKHIITVTMGKQTVSQELTVKYSVLDAVKNRTSEGYEGKNQMTLQMISEILNNTSIVNDNMTDYEKVRAIHDYLITSADYAKAYPNQNNDAYGAYGVLVLKDGVCQSYALAFQLLMYGLDIDCKYVTGVARSSANSSGGHAWNKVCIDGTWYYIDCTWDDPIGGGPQWDYFLSESLWSNHTVESETSSDEIDQYLWEEYYLDGSGYTIN